MYKTNYASIILKGDYYVLTRPLIYTEDKLANGFSLYVPPGFLVEKPYLPFWLRTIIPCKYNDPVIMYIYLLETKSLLYKKKPFAIENESCDILFIDMLSQRRYPKFLTPLLKILLKTFRPRKHNDPSYLLRKNAVEFFLKEKARDNGYYV